MERLVQCLDDLEDLYYAISMMSEAARRALALLGLISAALVMQALGIMLALASPPMALAAVSLTVVGLLYHSATSGHPVIC